MRISDGNEQGWLELDCGDAVYATSVMCSTSSSQICFFFYTTGDTSTENDSDLSVNTLSKWVFVQWVITPSWALH